MGNVLSKVRKYVARFLNGARSFALQFFVDFASIIGALLSMLRDPVVGVLAIMGIGAVLLFALALILVGRACVAAIEAVILGSILWLPLFLFGLVTASFASWLAVVTPVFYVLYVLNLLHAAYLVVTAGNESNVTVKPW